MLPLSTRLRRCAYGLAVLPGSRVQRPRRTYELASAVPFRAGPFHFWCERRFEGEAAELVGKVGEALTLISEVDPRRCSRLWADVPRVYIRGQVHGSYWRDENAIVLPAARVRDEEPVEIALTMIHEAAHARLEKVGIGYWPDLQQRIESRCVKEQLGFCRRLEAAGWGMDRRIKWYEHRLSGPLYERWSAARWALYVLFLPLLALPVWLWYTALAHAEETARERGQPRPLTSR